MRQNRRSDHHEPGVPSTLGDLLRARRKAEGLSLNQMAAEMDISRTYLARLEYGRQVHPSPVILSKIGKRLHVSTDDLYALSGHLSAADLPNLAPYLRAKHPDWPKLVITELDDYCDFLQHKYDLR